MADERGYSMFGFLFKLVFGAILIYLAKYLGSMIVSPRNPFNSIKKPVAFAIRALGIFMIAWAFIGTSLVWVPQNHIATLNRIYIGKSLPPGRIVALEGELGPQARIITAGFHAEPFLTLINKVEFVLVLNVPNGKCAIISSKDGIPNSSGSAFAEPWMDEIVARRMVNDATYFLAEGKGIRGPQTTVLGPGSYTINPFLWEAPKLTEATRVEQGRVGVVKSSVLAAVNFGSFKRNCPKDNVLTVLTADKLQKDSAGALIVPVGAIGVWEEPLPNGLYYINTDAYRITMVPTVAQVYEYKGGYKKRVIEVVLDDKGQISERPSDPVEVPIPATAADSAIFTKPEGWDVPQELRVLAQVSPEMAPFVVASLGLTQENAAQVIEDRVVTPIIRSVVRDVQGGAQIPFSYQRAVLDTNGVSMVLENGQPKIQTVSEFRAVRVLDLLENRDSLENAIETRVKPESMKEGVTINEIRLSESAIPPELLIARKREQLAQQLTKAWIQEELAQNQRKLTENARSQANQQETLVKAEIDAQAATKRAEARNTEGQGEKNYLVQIAEGQKIQAEVLGKDTTAMLQMYQQGLKIITEHPEILIEGFKNAHKFVPEVVVNGSGSGMEAAAGIFGKLFSGTQTVTEPPAPTKVTTPSDKK
jgi:hypothetical protein